ncbi:UNVERIFIED_CONTAM: Serine/threonine-protein kinase 3 [Siphonaria sp. JEL0065]|nr:Serine/threonine-protein kinase 3 [Siphonaria sp. JEL0065]
MPLLTEAELGMDPTRVFELQEKLGEGSYGTVHRALHLRTSTTVAVKILPVANTDLEQSIKEISFMTGIQSQFVVEYYGSYLRDTELWIVMEYCGAGSVSDLMELCNMTLSEDQISVVCRYTLKGLAYMHSMRKIHRDIKAGNILINSKGEAKLADFGVSGQLSDVTMKRQTVIGTPFWMVILAPEVIQEVGYGTAADIWSLGITCIEMADGRPPYHDIHPMRAIFMIPTKPPPKLEEEERYSKVFRSFVARCLTKDQKARPSAEELLNDPFIRRHPPTSAFSSMMSIALDYRRGSVATFLPEPDDNGDEEEEEVQVSREMDEPSYLQQSAAYPMQALNRGNRDTVIVREDEDDQDDEVEVFMAEEEYSIYAGNLAFDLFLKFESTKPARFDGTDESPSRPISPDADSAPSSISASLPMDKPKRDYGIGFVTKAFEYFSPSGTAPVNPQIPPGVPTPPSAIPSSILKPISRPPSPGSGVRARKRSITEERMLASLDDRKEAEIAAIVAKYKRRKEPVMNAILMKGGTV